MVAYLGVVYEYESILVILIDVILLINMKFTSNIINGWQQHEGDSGVDVISAWSDNDDGYPLAILLFFYKSSIQLCKSPLLKLLSKLHLSFVLLKN
jgi:hypothetical protein